MKEESKCIDVWGELVRTRDAVPNMLWPAITESTLRELALSFEGPMHIDIDHATSLGIKAGEPTGCAITRVEVKHDDKGFYLAGLLHAPPGMVERGIHWTILRDEPIGAKLLALYFANN